MSLGEGKEGVKWEGGRGTEKGPLSLQRGLLLPKSLEADTSKREKRRRSPLCGFGKDAITKGASELN